MALTDENGSSNLVMPVAPMYGGNNGGFLGGADGSWFILFILILMCGGGWGNGFGGGFGGNNLPADSAVMYPWMNQSNQIHDGFRDQMINGTVNGIQSAVTSGFADTALGIAGINQNICQTGNGVMNALNTGFAGVNSNLCNGFAGVTAGMNNGFSQAEISANARQMATMQQGYTNQIADMERSYAAQTAQTAQMTALQAQLAQASCDNRQSTADLKYTVATENCADRTAAMQNTRDIIDAQTRGTQAILDKLCALELDGVKSQLAQAQRENTGLQNQLNMANLAASQANQNAFIQQGLTNEVDQLYNRLKNCPVPSYPVCNPTAPPYSQGCGCA